MGGQCQQLMHFQTERRASGNRATHHSSTSGRWKEAAADLTKVVELDPKTQWSWLQLAPLLVETDNLADYKNQRSDYARNLPLRGEMPTPKQRSNW
jgi:predicted Zn-dependent protease